MKKEFSLNSELNIIKKDWKGNLKINGRFAQNLSKSDGIMATIKWIIRMKFFGKKMKSFVKVSNDFEKIPEKDYMLWLGHSCFLIKINGKLIITDPCFYDLPFSPRLVNFNPDLSKFEKIDYILISHNHLDHLNIKSLKNIVNSNANVKILAPLGSKSILSKISMNVEEASWFQEYKTDKIKIHFMPAYHWTRSNITNMNKVLWGGFIIQFKDKTLFFAGDTTSKNNFKDIKKFFPKIDYFFVPIAPSIYPKFHLSGDEAIKIAKFLRSKKIIPMHYGTYQQSTESGDYSINLFINEAKKQNLIKNCLILPMNKYFKI